MVVEWVEWVSHYCSCCVSRQTDRRQEWNTNQALASASASSQSKQATAPEEKTTLGAHKEESAPWEVVDGTMFQRWGQTRNSPAFCVKNHSIDNVGVCRLWKIPSTVEIFDTVSTTAVLRAAIACILTFIIIIIILIPKGLHLMSNSFINPNRSGLQLEAGG